MGYIFHAWKKILKDTLSFWQWLPLQGEIVNTCLYGDLFTRNVFMFKNVYLLCLYMNGIVLDPVPWVRQALRWRRRELLGVTPVRKWGRTCWTEGEDCSCDWSIMGALELGWHIRVALSWGKGLEYLYPCISQSLGLDCPWGEQGSSLQLRVIPREECSWQWPGMIFPADGVWMHGALNRVLGDTLQYPRQLLGISIQVIFWLCRPCLITTA